MWTSIKVNSADLGFRGLFSGPQGPRFHGIHLAEYGAPNGSKIVFWRGGDTSLEIEILLVDSEILLQRSRYFFWIVRYFFRNRDTSMETGDRDVSMEIETSLEFEIRFRRLLEFQG